MILFYLLLVSLTTINGRYNVDPIERILMLEKEVEMLKEGFQIPAGHENQKVKKVLTEECTCMDEINELSLDIISLQDKTKNMDVKFQAEIDQVSSTTSENSLDIDSLEKSYAELKDMVFQEIIDRQNAVDELRERDSELEDNIFKEEQSRKQTDDQIEANMDKFPVGTIISLINTDVPDKWIPCSGQLITEGPLKDTLAPDMNKAARFIRGSEAPGTVQESGINLSGVRFTAQTNPGYSYTDIYLFDEEDGFSCAGSKNYHSIWSDHSSSNPDGEGKCTETRAIPQMDVNVVITSGSSTETRPINIGLFFVMKIL